MFKYPFSFLLLLVFTACSLPAQVTGDQLLANHSEDSLFTFESNFLPYSQDTTTILHHSGFSLCYAEQHKQSRWVCYYLDSARMKKVVSRTDNFKPDPLIQNGTATVSDYRKSGYDRGHLAPAADMAWSEISMHESFYFSNISPQIPAFNRGVWKRLEEQVRNWVNDTTTLFITTGPVLKDSLPCIGTGVSIPKAYYKALLSVSKSGNIKSIAFILENASSTAPLTNFALSVDSLENLTGLDFFYALPDEMEKRIESELCIPCWFKE